MSVDLVNFYVTFLTKYVLTIMMKIRAIIQLATNYPYFLNIDNVSSTPSISTSISDSTMDTSMITSGETATTFQYTFTTSTSTDTTIMSITNTQSSSSTIIGVLVGVVVILLILLLIVAGVVIIGCFIIKKREKNQTRAQHLQDVSNITDKLDSSEITTQNIHYKSNLRSQSSSVVPPDRVTPAIVGNDMYSRLNHNESTQGNSRPLINSHEAKQETSYTYDDVASNELNEDSYSIVDDTTKQKVSAKSQQKSEEFTSSSITPDKKSLHFSAKGRCSSSSQEDPRTVQRSEHGV